MKREEKEFIQKVLIMHNSVLKHMDSEIWEKEIKEVQQALDIIRKDILKRKIKAKW